MRKISGPWLKAKNRIVVYFVVICSIRVVLNDLERNLFILFKLS